MSTSYIFVFPTFFASVCAGECVFPSLALILIAIYTRGTKSNTSCCVRNCVRGNPKMNSVALVEGVTNKSHTSGTFLVRKTKIFLIFDENSKEMYQKAQLRSKVAHWINSLTLKLATDFLIGHIENCNSKIN